MLKELNVNLVLFVVGWLAFVSGFLVEDAWLKLMFMSVARILP